MVNDITKAFRVRDGVSFGGDIYIFTGNVKPPSSEIPSASAGSLYLYAAAGEATIYQHDGIDWIPGSGGDPTSGWAIYNPYEYPTFSVEGVYKSHWLENDDDGYYLTLHRAVEVEFRGISGSIYNIDSNKKLIGVDTEDDDDDDSKTTNSFSALYSLTPGYYRVQVGRWGDLMIRLHGHSGSKIATWPTTSWAESVTQVNSIFTWHDGPEDPWTV